MDNLTPRLISCFQAVFPDLPAPALPSVTQAAVPAWDSVATITLVSVIDDEFHMQLDLERLDEFNSFAAIHAFLAEKLPE